MDRLNTAAHHIPVAGFATVRLGTASKEFGLLFTERPDMNPLLISGDGVAMFTVPLGGKQPFRYSRLGMGSTIRGVLFREVRLAADVTSLVNHNADAPLGALVFQDGKAAIFASNARDGFGEVEPFPLPFDVDGSNEAPFAFKRWSVWTTIEGEAFELWRNAGPGTSEAAA